MILAKIRERAAADLQHIILPEGEDIRTVKAAAICTQQRVARITILGGEDKVRGLAASANVNLNGVEVLDHRKSADFGKLATLYHQMRKAKGVTLEEAEE